VFPFGVFNFYYDTEESRSISDCKYIVTFLLIFGDIKIVNKAERPVLLDFVGIFSFKPYAVGNRLVRA
jgi:hypothetical protein